MRDPARIPLVLAAIERAWLHHEDWRLGQVINLACRSIEKDVHHFVLLEDDDLLDGLRKLAEGLESGEGSRR